MIKTILILFLACTLNADYLVLKLGTRGIHRTESEMRKDWVDGQIVEILPDTDPISDHMKTHFQIVKVAKHYTQSEKDEILRSSFTADGQLITRRRYYVPITDITGMADSKTLATVYAKQTVKPIADLTAFKETDIIKDSFKLQITTNSFDKGGSISIGTCSIGTGMDYATVNAFEAGLASVLNGAVTGYVMVKETHTTIPYFQGTVTNSTAPVILIVDSSVKHNGTIGSGFNMVGAGTTNLRLYDRFITIDGVEFNGVEVYPLPDAGASKQIIKNCLISNATPEEGAILLGVGGITSEVGIYNNIVTSTTKYAVGGSGLTVGTTVYIYNNTFARNNRGINISRVSSIYVYEYNNICNSNAVDYNVSGVTLISSANISSDATSPNTYNRNKLCSFVSSTTYNFTLASDDTKAMNNALDLSADPYVPFNTDIIGTTRPQGAAWDIGSFEYVSAEPPVAGGKRRIPYMRGFVLQ